MLEYVLLVHAAYFLPIQTNIKFFNSELENVSRDSGVRRDVSQKELTFKLQLDGGCRHWKRLFTS